jgi:hypothetical protein
MHIPHQRLFSGLHRKNINCVNRIDLIREDHEGKSDEDNNNIPASRIYI